MSDYLLGIDNGSTLAKAALFTLDGREVACVARKLEMAAAPSGWSELDAEALWHATASAVREVLHRAGVHPQSVVCIGCTGHGNGVYLVDERGRPVRPGIGSSDARARKWVDRWLAEGLDRRMRPLTMQAVWPAQPNALLNWLRDFEPNSVARASAAVMCKDYTRGRLTGEIHAEVTDMSGTSLLNVGTGAYDDAVLEGWGLADLRRLLPPLRRPEEICGHVTAEAAEATGLAAGTPVAGGLFDIDACGLSSGMVDENTLTMVAGTWGINEYIARKPVVHENIFMSSCYAIPGYYLMLEGSATSASNLEWFVTQFFAAERDEVARQGGSVFELCNRLVAKTHPEDAGAIFLPFLYGSNVSLDGRACFLGLDGWQSRGHVLRAIYEGVVFSHKWHVERLLAFRAMPRQVRLTGGASRSQVWLQVFADILQVPVEVPDGTELGALGAAIAAAVAAQVYPSYEAACAAMVRIARSCEPDRSRADLYAAKYARYLRALEAMAPLWSDLAWKHPTKG